MYGQLLVELGRITKLGPSGSPPNFLPSCVRIGSSAIASTNETGFSRIENILLGIIYKSPISY